MKLSCPIVLPLLIIVAALGALAGHCIPLHDSVCYFGHDYPQ